VKPGEEDTKAHELVIIKRRSGGEEGGHHGGVWKIAYADFMTAMMAFFLVMWLINSTDQKVLTQVANYFNPMRLTDSTPHSRGLNTIESGEQGKQGKQDSVGDPKEKANAKAKKKDKSAEMGATKGEGDAKGESEGKGEGAKGESKGGEGKGGEGKDTEAKARFTEQALFSDPYGVLARIAAEAPHQAVAKDASGAGGEVYRDPFDPATQHPAPGKRVTIPQGKAGPMARPLELAKPAEPVTPVETPAPRGEAKQLADNAPAPNPQGAELKETAAKETLPKEALPKEALPKEAVPTTGIEATKLPESAVATSMPSATADVASDQTANQEVAKAAQQATAEKAARAEAAKIENDVKRLTTQMRGTLPTIDVTTNDDGVLISLTDDYDFGMFAVASAEPRPAMVVVMEKMAKILQQYPYPLVVRGHTDGRPYRSGNYDNWRLSTARAHMAYYMLVRGGVADKRFERIEGYADHSLRVPNDPGAAQNRRIEILLRRPKP
jgi:chemotaxis protein MotB